MENIDGNVQIAYNDPYTENYRRVIAPDKRIQ